MTVKFQSAEHERWPVLIKNTSGQEIPAFGCVVIDGEEATALNNQMAFTVARPAAADQEGSPLLLLNGRFKIPDTTGSVRGYGAATAGPIGTAIWEDTTPSIGDRFRPKADSFVLESVSEPSAKASFICVGIADETLKLMKVRFVSDEPTEDPPSTGPTGLRLARLTEDLLKCQTGSAKLLIPCGCSGDTEIAVRDRIGIATLATGGSGDYAPEGSLAWVQPTPCVEGDDQYYDVVNVGEDCCPPCDICSGVFVGVGDYQFEMADGQSVTFDAPNADDCDDCEGDDVPLIYLGVSCDADFVTLTAYLTCGESVADPEPGTGDPPAEPLAQTTVQIPTADICENCVGVNLDLDCVQVPVSVSDDGESCGAECTECLELQSSTQEAKTTQCTHVGYAVMEVDSGAAWCEDDVKRFTYTLTNLGSINPSYPDDYEIGAPANLGGVSADCILIGFNDGNNLGGGAFEIVDASDPIGLCLQSGTLTLPQAISSNSHFSIKMPRQTLHKNESISVWFDLKRIYAPSATVPQQVFVYAYTSNFPVPCVGTFRNQSGTIIHRCDAEPTGACCTAGPTCSITTEAVCTGMGGTWLGEGTDCSGPSPCPEI